LSGAREFNVTASAHETLSFHTPVESGYPTHFFPQAQPEWLNARSPRRPPCCRFFLRLGRSSSGRPHEYASMPTGPRTDCSTAGKACHGLHAPTTDDREETVENEPDTSQFRQWPPVEATARRPSIFHTMQSWQRWSPAGHQKHQRGARRNAFTIIIAARMEAIAQT